MATSLDTLQQKAQNAPGLGAAQQVQRAAPIQIASANDLQKQVQTAVSGKQSAAESGPQMSNLAAERAAAAAQLQQSQLQTQIQNQDNAQAQTEEEAFMQLDDSAFQVREQAVALRRGMQQKLGEILQNYEAQRQELGVEKEKSLAEQAGFLMRLGNEKYITNLKMEGAKARLDNDSKFKEAMLISLFKNQQELLDRDLEFKSLLRADDREFATKLGKMDINMAISVFNSEMDRANTAQQFQAGADVFSGITQAAFSAKKPNTEEALNNADKYGTAGGGSDNDPNTQW